VLGGQSLGQTFCFELLLDQAFGEIVLLRSETEVQFVVDFSKLAADFLFTSRQCFLVVGADPDSLLGLGQFVLHLPNCLLEQHLGLFDLIQNGMKVRFE
jgi:hypothetical protein